MLGGFNILDKEKLLINKNNEPFSSDSAANGATSRWLQTETERMRIIKFPANYHGDHVCYKGHSIYVISGCYEMKVGDTVLEWQEGDAFIIPDGIPHRSKNSGKAEVKIIMFDNHT